MSRPAVSVIYQTRDVPSRAKAFPESSAVSQYKYSEYFFVEDDIDASHLDDHQPSAISQI